jgi:Ca-activated chloride channel homolog
MRISVALVLLVATPAGLCPAFGQAGSGNSFANTAPAAGQTLAPSAWPDVIVNFLLDSEGKTRALPISVASMQVFEDGVAQKIQAVSGPDDPVSLCLMIDVSGSMTKYQDAVAGAAKELVKSLPPGSEVTVSTFAEKPYLVLSFTPATEIDLSIFGRMQHGVRTALNDAIVNTEPSFVRLARYPRRALVLISDGGDNASRHHASDAIRSMEVPSGPFVYVLGISDPYAPTPEERMSFASLDSFSSAGARIAKLPNARELLTGATEISACINRQYALNYRSALSAPDKRLHQIVMKLPEAPEPIKIEAQPGYYIPSQ